MPSLTKIHADFVGPLSSGTASAPILKFSDSSTTGIFSPNTGEIAFSTSGQSQAVTFKTDGKVGIGISSPVYNLDVIGDINFTGTLRQNGSAFSGGGGGGGGGSNWTTSGNNIYRQSKVGINQNNPTDNLEILHTNGNGITFKTSQSHYAQITSDVNRTGGDSFLLALEGQWNGTPVSEIALVTGSDTTNKDDGEIIFRTSSANNLTSNERLRITNAGLVKVPDNGKFTAGAGDDLQIYHDGSNSYIDDTGTGRLNIRGNTGISLRNYSNSNQFINCYTDGTVELFHNNSKKLETTSSGVTVTGTLAATAVTGDGSGLTGVTLNGQQGSYYTGYTDTAISNLIDSSPGTLNTLNELAAALGDDANFSTTVTNSIAAKLPLAGGTMTGTLNMGSNNITTTGKVLFANMYSAENNLPSATTYHGMFAHVHGTGKGYFAHGGSWIKLLDESSSNTGNLSEGSNLYHTTARAISAVTGSNLNMGSNNITTTGKVLFANMYSALGDLPSASTYHGMFAHVHGTGKGYFAHGGNWIRLLDINDEGSGNGLDADTVDGQEGSYYLNYNNFTNTPTQTDNNFTTTLKNKLDGIEASATADQTAAEILTAIKTVDGSGSGLDADLLDGLQGSVYLSKGSSSSYYQPDNWIDFNTTNVGLYWAGSTSAGWHIYPADASNMRFRTSGNTCALRLETNNGTTRGSVYADNSSNIGFLNSSANWRIKVPSSGSILRDGTHTIWDSGNDGASSGLDADTVDGLQASQFLRADATNTITTSGDQKLILSGSNSPYIRYQSGTTNKHYTQSDSSGFYIWDSVNNTGIRLTGSTPQWYDASAYQTIWHSGNDGVGSGLDADTLDGSHASSFVQADSNGDILLADGKKLLMSGFANGNSFNVASIFVDAIKCGNLRIHDGKETSGGSGLQHNTIIGNSARTFSYASGDDNTVVGSYAGYEMTTGHDNTLIGFRAQQKVTTGGFGTFVGVDAGKNKRYGDYCTAIGYKADFYTTSGNNNDTENYSNTTCLGYDSRPSGSNQVVAGDSNTILHYYGLSNRSDARDKIDIQDEFLGLDFIKKLKPRAYKWDYRDVYFDEVFDEVEYSENPGEFEKVPRLVPVPKDGSRSGTRLHHGLIAQEVKELIDETGVDFAGYQDHKVKDGEDVLSMNYLELIAPMIKAIQEQQVQIEALTAMIESMK